LITEAHGSIKETKERKNKNKHKMNNETPTIKLTGRFPNTFKVIKEKGKPLHPYNSDLPKDEFLFEWDNGEEQTMIPVSLHGAIKLAEQFEKFGYTPIR